ncbi:phenolic glucoside malonyltransferase 2 [Prunus yedoensis var. nudiflora]|uniref:Phenolic glucoside malonyltransferase 2 n=1 Tax=Prunus yedoensis var. nudiflora TaxID=2094558 RepID=A0A314Z8D8_PRUYE|nr:phenolic glucoside malonyltransferase 2 [Prunus yedoensis var. nudiflora]
MAMMAKKKQQDHSVLHLSTFSLTCAYTWVCLVKAEEIKAEKILLVFSADCRSRLDPSLPATYFGNCIAGRGVVAETKGLLGEDGLPFWMGQRLGVSRMLNALQTTDRVHSIAGSHTFGIYEATDFGWGRPTKIDFVSIDRTGAISFSDSKNGAGGVEVGLIGEAIALSSTEALHWISVLDLKYSTIIMKSRAYICRENLRPPMLQTKDPSQGA